MITRIIFAAIGKKVYKEDYSLLRKKLLTEYHRVNIPIELKEELKKFLISGEDHRFRFHCGFDIIAITRAIKNRIFHNKIEGASTIEQQLVRVLTNNYEKTFKRKIKEIFLATTLSKIIPRKDIPFVYINIAYYGTEMVGLSQALTKFDNVHDIKFISSELIARIKYPEPRQVTPRIKNQIKKRRNHLLTLYSKHNKLNKIIKIYG